MKAYVAIITGDKYPMTYRVEASNWSTAASRAVKLWRQRFKGSRTPTLTIRLAVASQIEAPPK